MSSGLVWPIPFSSLSGCGETEQSGGWSASIEGSQLGWAQKRAAACSIPPACLAVWTGCCNSPTTGRPPALSSMLPQPPSRPLPLSLPTLNPSMPARISGHSTLRIDTIGRS